MRKGRQKETATFKLPFSSCVPSEALPLNIDSFLMTDEANTDSSRVVCVRSTNVLFNDLKANSP